MRWFLLSSLFALVNVSHAVVGPGTVTGNTAVHDPTMCKDNSGKYFIFSTAVGLEIRTSTDRTAWTLVGKVWPNGASWTDAYTGTSNGALWAPDCYYSNGQFYLYYAASSFGSQKATIILLGLALNAENSYRPVCWLVSDNSIDIIHWVLMNDTQDGSNWYLSLGSFWTGIKLQTCVPASSAVTALAQRTAGGGAIEASVIFKFGSFYYLFSSWDKCCAGTSSTYNIRVGRSSSATGGYVDKSGVALTSGGGTLVLGSHDNIIGPGGQDVMTDGDGPILIYHYYTSAGSFLGINRLDSPVAGPLVI
ncbi:glycoside hydrolase family 43 protein [Infundibulicybe gibba]|nr:glycoside hydrolase family 43 protein [Infundibulicybe gibba]